MSRNNLGQICPKKAFDNRQLSQHLVSILRKNGITRKQLADDLDISTERVKNWYDKKIGMTALDLLKMIYKYDFIRNTIIDSSLFMKQEA